MIGESDPAELTEQAVAQKVAEYLRDCHPGGVTLEVVPDGVHKGEFVWRVPVRPSEEPTKLFQYYEALADVEIELDEREHLKVFLVPNEPAQPRMVEDKVPCTPPAGKRERRPRFTKQAVAQKVAEYLRDCHPGGITLEVDANRIRKEDHWWEVPVRPDVEPRKLSEYYEALAHVEEELEEREQLNVFLVPSDPREEQAA